jgi:hypothetical protein
MTSSYTANKHLEQPGNGDYVGNWNVPVNADWAAVDNALGGVQPISLTGSSGTITLSATSSPSYVPLILSLSGVPTGAVNIQFPSGVGGEWVVINACTGTYSSVTFSNAAGGATTVVSAGQTRSIVSVTSPPGYGVVFADSQTTVAGSDTQVIINESGTLTGTSGLTYSYSAGTPTLTANALAVTTNAAITGNQTVGGTVTATGTIKSNTSFTFPDSTVQTTAYTSPIPTMVVLSTPGGGTFTVPAGVTKIKVTVTGGGASCVAGYFYGGGGAGGTAIKTLTGLTSGSTISYFVGAGSTGSANGVSSSFSAPSNTIIGYGGLAATTTVGGSGGSASGGDLNITGGGGGSSYTSNYTKIIGTGGNSYWGSGASGANTNGPLNGGSYGGGANDGGTGGNGVIVIEY